MRQTSPLKNCLTNSWSTNTSSSESMPSPIHPRPLLIIVRGIMHVDILTFLRTPATTHHINNNIARLLELFVKYVIAQSIQPKSVKDDTLRSRLQITHLRPLELMSDGSWTQVYFVTWLPTFNNYPSTLTMTGPMKCSLVMGPTFRSHTLFLPLFLKTLRPFYYQKLNQVPERPELYW